MQTISKTIEFDAGHRVPTHAGQCRSPHGHRYKVTVRVSGRVVPDLDLASESGMVTDFAFLKDTMMRLVHKTYDHAFIVWEKDDAMRGALARRPDVESRGRAVHPDCGEPGRCDPARDGRRARRAPVPCRGGRGARDPDVRGGRVMSAGWVQAAVGAVLIVGGYVRAAVPPSDLDDPMASMLGVAVIGVGVVIVGAAALRGVLS